MAVRRGFTKFQKERRRQEKAALKRQQRTERKKAAEASGERGAGPPIDHDSRLEDFAPLDDEIAEEE